MDKKILNFEGKCVICDKKIEPQKIRCKKCNKFCSPVIPSDFLSAPDGTKAIIDIKSDCCGEDIEFIGNFTCSETCHDEYVLNLEMDLGKYQKIVDKNGIAYKVPTKDIVEMGGLTHEELVKYPLWENVRNLTVVPRWQSGQTRQA